MKTVSQPSTSNNRIIFLIVIFSLVIFFGEKAKAENSSLGFFVDDSCQDAYDDNKWGHDDSKYSLCLEWGTDENEKTIEDLGICEVDTNSACCAQPPLIDMQDLNYDHGAGLVFNQKIDGGESPISFFNYQTVEVNSGDCDDDMPYTLCYFEPDQFYSYRTDTATSTIGKVKYVSIGGPCDIKFETIDDH